jgi:hypothetical protein
MFRPIHRTLVLASTLILVACSTETGGRSADTGTREPDARMDAGPAPADLGAVADVVMVTGPDSPAADRPPSDSVAPDSVASISDAHVPGAPEAASADAFAEADGRSATNAGDAGEDAATVDGPAGADAAMTPDADPCALDVDFTAPFCLTGKLWPDGVIPVCWSQQSAGRPDFAALSRRVQDTVMDRMARPSWADFLGWQTCATGAGDAGGPVPADRVVLDLRDGAAWSADLGFGTGGERQVQLGVGAPSLEGVTLAAFLRVLGLTPRSGERDPAKVELDAEEIAGLAVHYGDRPGGAIMGAGGRCLRAQGEAPPAGPGPAVEVAECFLDEMQDWRRSTIGHLLLARRDQSRLTAGDSAAGAVLQLPAGTEAQRWRVTEAEPLAFGGKCVTVPGNHLFDGQILALGACDGSPSQRWEMLADGRIAHEDHCWDIPGGIAARNAVIKLRPCSTAASQRFYYRPRGDIRFEDMCVDVGGGLPVDGSLLQLFPCKAANRPAKGNQVFYFRGQIRNGTKCLQMPARTSSAVVLADCDDMADQRWDVHPQSILSE